MLVESGEQVLWKKKCVSWPLLLPLFLISSAASLPFFDLPAESLADAL